MAAAIGLVCVAAVAAEMGAFGKAGDGGDAAARDALESQGPRPATTEGDGRFFAQVPGSPASYGWRYPYAFPLEPSLKEYREASEPAIRHGSGR
jgi:hypothetical protein